jgi:predicted O-methyltransferase YrrM
VSTTQSHPSPSGEAPSFAAALTRVQGVEGWLTDAQAHRLWNTAAALRPGARVVEIGSFRGRSTIVLASAAAEGVELVAIDPHGGGDRGPQEITPDAVAGDADFAAFNANLDAAGVQPRIRHVRAMSDQALGEVSAPIDLLFIDGAHRYAPARADIEQWGSRVAAGGSMLIHDSFNAIGVTLAQMRLLFASSEWRYCGRAGSLAHYRREHMAAQERLANARKQLGDLPYFVRNMAIKVYLVARGRQDGGSWPY